MPAGNGTNSEDENMIRATLTRNTYWSTGTYGVLMVDDFSLMTAECPWLQNKRYISCLPEGEYKVERYDSPKFGDCFILTGKGLTKFNDGAGRFGCLIHSANWPDQLNGCISVGQILKPIESQGRLWPKTLGVTSSKPSLKRLLDAMPNEWMLTIKGVRADYVEPKL